MNHVLLIPGIFLLSLRLSLAQDPALTYEDITIILPSEEKPVPTYFSFTGGLQLPFWINVPLTPVNSPLLKKRSDMEVQTNGWFAGIGIHKKPLNRLEVGLLLDYYRNSFPLAYSGQVSTSEWVYEQSGGVSPFTEVFDSDILRMSKTYVIRGTIRYIHPFHSARLWGGITGGTYSSVIRMGDTDRSEPEAINSQTALGIGFQSGMSFIIKDKGGEDSIGLTLFGDFISPKIQDHYINLFNTGWVYENTEGSSIIGPIRLGMSIELH